MRRLLLAVPVLLGIMTAVFIMLQLIPGDPALALAGEKGSVEQVERIREELGLNRPLPVQYAYFLKSAFTLEFRRLHYGPINRLPASCASSSARRSS